MRLVGLLVVCAIIVVPVVAQSPVPGTLPPGLMAQPGLAPVSLTENLRSFDPFQVKLEWNNRRWQLVAGHQVLKDFGTREQEGRQALRLIMELGLNQFGTIGSPTTVMEYWLVNGQAPSGPVRWGLRAVPFTPANLRLEQTQGQWCIRDSSRVLFAFGSQVPEAQLALTTIRKYHFDQVGVLGQGTPSMCIFFARPQDPSASAPTLLGSSSGRQISTPRFSRLAKNADGSPRTEKLPGQKAPSGFDLSGVVSPVVSPVDAKANPSPGRAVSGGDPSAFHWRTQPHVGYQPPPKENDRVPFDWRQVQLRQDQGDWKLMAGSLPLANFGPRLHEGQMALSALRYYRFTEQWQLGGDHPYFTYFGAGGTAPRGMLLGLQGESFQPEKVEVQKVATGYALVQGQRVLVRLRDREEDARKLLDTIKTQRYDRLCQLGEPGKEAMTFLVRSR